MADAQMLSKVDGVNKNLAAIVKALTTAFVGQASVGTFTMAAAATKTVTDANVKASSYVLPFALNAAAGTLMGSANAIYTTAANGSFTAATASAGNAAGTEQFAYLVLNIA
jgi:hypothetical protein